MRRHTVTCVRLFLGVFLCVAGCGGAVGDADSSTETDGPTGTDTGTDVEKEVKDNGPFADEGVTPDETNVEEDVKDNGPYADEGITPDEGPLADQLVDSCGDGWTCGDGWICGDEECDDGNDIPWDGCTDCRITEFQVSGVESWEIDKPGGAVAGVFDDGSFLVVWDGYRTEDSDGGIFLRPFPADGSEPGEILTVNSSLPHQQSRPVLAVFEDGGFVIAWESDKEAFLHSDIRARRFSSGGVPLDEDFPVNTHATGYHGEPCLAGLPDGRFVVLWQTGEQDGDGAGIFGQMYGADGAPAGTEFQANADSNHHQSKPDVARFDDGRFLVVWSLVDTIEFNSPKHVFGRLFEKDGSPSGSDFPISDPQSLNVDLGWPSLAVFPGGAFITTWTAWPPKDGKPTNFHNVLARVLVSGDSSAAEEHWVVAQSDVSQIAGDVVVPPGGDSRVAWDYDYYGNGGQVFVSRVDPTGTPQGPALQVNVDTALRHQGLSLAVIPPTSDSPAGGFIAVWKNSKAYSCWIDTTCYHKVVLAQRFNADGTRIHR